MYQKITIVGNLGRDPEMRYMPDGTAATSFNVATSRRWKDGQTGETRSETTWFRCSVWGRRAEVANQYLSRGKKVMVEGRLVGDPNTGGPKLFTRQDGSVGSSFEIRVFDFVFLSGRDEAGVDMGSDSGPSSSSSSTPAVEEDDIPF